jgi:hypothetical protein
MFTFLKTFFQFHTERGFRLFLQVIWNNTSYSIYLIDYQVSYLNALLHQHLDVHLDTAAHHCWQ